MAMNWVDQGGYLTNNKLSKEWRESAQPIMRFRQFVDVKEAFGKSAGAAFDVSVNSGAFVWAWDQR